MLVDVVDGLTELVVGSRFISVLVAVIVGSTANGLLYSLLTDAGPWSRDRCLLTLLEPVPQTKRSR